MISEELKSIIEVLKKQGKMIFVENATEKQINLFEKEKDVVLPSKFKEWLMFSDGGEFFLPASVQIYGVAHKPLINLEEDDRPNNEYVVIGTLASGEPILFKRNEEKIYIFDHDCQEISDDLIYDDFFALLKDLYDLLGIGG